MFSTRWWSGKQEGAKTLYKVLEVPLVYRASQFIIAPGMDGIVTELLSRTFSQMPAPARVLDVGCGPSSWLWKFGMKPLGLDLCHAYTRRFNEVGSRSITASAASLPFSADCFDLVFSYGLVHHLPQTIARASIEEIIRVTCAGGHVVLFDPVLPKEVWRRPQAWALCKLDRGRFIRTQEVYESSILKNSKWKTFRFTHSYLGTEGVLSVLRKSN